MVMKPLLLHASHKVFVDRPRRVLHFVYGPSNLPHGLRWPPSVGGDYRRLSPTFTTGH